jgi:hypothetical protein
MLDTKCHQVPVQGDYYYIAGPMRGQPAFNKAAFDAAAARLRTYGFGVVTPVELDEQEGYDLTDPAFEPNDLKVAELLERDLVRISYDEDCIGIYVLDGWLTSEGCKQELTAARMAGKPVFAYSGGREISEVVDQALGITDSRDIIKDETRICSRTGGEEEDILDEAKRITSGEREESYGPPRQDFRRTAGLWAAYKTGVGFTPTDVAVMMMLLKISRLSWSPGKRDNWVDAAGYARCGWLCEQEMPTIEQHFNTPNES